MNHETTTTTTIRSNLAVEGQRRKAVLGPWTNQRILLFYVRLYPRTLWRIPIVNFYITGAGGVTFNARRGLREIRTTNYAVNPTAKYPKDHPCPPVRLGNLHPGTKR